MIINSLKPVTKRKILKEELYVYRNENNGGSEFLIEDRQEKLPKGEYKTIEWLQILLQIY